MSNKEKKLVCSLECSDTIPKFLVFCLVIVLIVSSFLNNISLTISSSFIIFILFILDHNIKVINYE